MDEEDFERNDVRAAIQELIRLTIWLERLRVRVLWLGFAMFVSVAALTFVLLWRHT